MPVIKKEQDMVKIISTFKEMPPREMLDCRIRVIRNCMRYYGLNMDSYILLLLGLGVDFTFYKEEYGGQSNFVLWGVGATDSFIEEEILKNMEIPHERHIIDNDTSGWKRLKEFVDGDTPVIVKLESGYLNENNTVRKQGDQRHLGGVSSAGLVGYDEGSDAVYLDFLTESMDEIPGYLHKVSLKNFMISRNTNCFPHSPQNKCYTFYVPEGYSTWLDRNINELLKNSILQICDRMLHIDESGGECSGINGINVLSQKLDEFGNIIRDLDLDRPMSDKLFLIKLKTLRIGMTIGSYTLYRDEFGHALKRASLALANKGLDKMGQEFINAGQQWRELARLLAACEYKLGDKHKYICRLSEQYKKLADIEEKLFSRLKNFL